MKHSLTYTMLFFCSQLFAQMNIVGVPEKLGQIPIGYKSTDAFYFSNDEGFYSLGSPIIDQSGHIVFLKSVGGENSFVVMGDITRESFPYQGNLSDFRLTGNRHIDSQQGIQIDTTPLIYTDKRFYEYNYRDKSIKLTGGYYKLYPTPFGGLYFSEKEKTGIAIVFDIQNPSMQFSVVTQDKIKAWISSQPGGFTIGDDGLLYRNGLIWSAILPKGYNGARYLGKLASGHNIWGSGDYGMESWFALSNSKGEIELQFSLPWRYKDGKVTDTNFNYGVGPWGELYCLIAPPTYVEKSDTPRGDGPPPKIKFDDTIPAELVVVRNHLKYFGRLNDGGVRLRKEPTTSGDILGTYPNKTGFRIIEAGTKEETIGGQKNVWYKVRLLDGTEGWFFGSFVHILYDGPNGNPPPWPNVADW